MDFKIGPSRKHFVAVPAPANNVMEASSEILTSKKYMEPIGSSVNRPYLVIDRATEPINRNRSELLLTRHNFDLKLKSSLTRRFSQLGMF